MIIPFFIVTKNKRINIKISKISLPWIILNIYFIFSLIYSIDMGQTMYYLVIYSFGFLFLTHQLDEKFYNKLINALEITTICCAITILISAIFPNLFNFITNWFKVEVADVYDTTTNGYFAGILFEKARAAFVMNIGICIVGTNLLVKKENYKSNILKLIVLFIGLFLTGKRALTVIGVIAIIGIFILSNNNKYKYRKLLITSFIAIIGIAIVCLLFPKVGYVFERMTNIGSTIGGREVFWNTCTKMFKESPIIGKGIGTFNTYLSDTGFTYYAKEWTSNAHNSYLQVLAETGIIGFILLIFAFAYTIIRTIGLIYRYKKKKDIDISVYRNIYIVFGMQVIFLLYAITGNPFHNFFELYVYIIFVGLLNTLLSREDIGQNKDLVKEELEK